MYVHAISLLHHSLLPLSPSSPFLPLPSSLPSPSLPLSLILIPLSLSLCSSIFRCFDRFFRMVNINERRLSAWRRGFITENVDLVGLEYLWKAVLLAPDSIVYKPIELLKDVYTNLSNKLQADQVHVCIYHPLTFSGPHCTLLLFMYT